MPLTWDRTVILPHEALLWSDEQLQAALRHEMAHLRRRDSLFRRMGEFATAVLWPQPLLWPARRLWHRMQEHACDDAVIRSGSDAASYAELLCQAARAWTRQTPGTLAMAQPSSLEKRIRAVMDPDGNRRNCSRWHFAAAVTAGFLSFSAAALAQKPAVPKPADPPKATASAVKTKAMKLKVPRAQFAEATIDQAIQYIAAKSKELDPDKKGIALKNSTKSDRTVTLELRNASVWDLLTTVAELTGTHLETVGDEIHFKGGAPSPPPPDKPAKASAVEEKAKSLRIDRIAFEGASVDEIASYVRRKAQEIDHGAGVNIVVKDAGPGEYTLAMTDVSVWDLLVKLAELSGMNAPRVNESSKGEGVILLDRGPK